MQVCAHLDEVVEYSKALWICALLNLQQRVPGSAWMHRC